MNHLTSNLSPVISTRIFKVIFFIALITAAISFFGDWLHTHHRLPFGYQYQVTINSDTHRGLISEITPQYISRSLSHIAPFNTIRQNGLLIFRSTIFNAGLHYWSFHCAPANRAILYVNKKRVLFNPQAYFNPIPFRRGLNDVVIQYFPPKSSKRQNNATPSKNEQFLFYISEAGYRQLPYYCLLLPNERLSLLLGVLLICCRFLYVMSIVSLLVLALFQAGRAVISICKPFRGNQSPSPHSSSEISKKLVFSLKVKNSLILYLLFLIHAIYFHYTFSLNFPFVIWLIFIIPAPLLISVFWLHGPPERHSSAFNLRIVILFLTLCVVLQILIYKATGHIFPLSPTGKGDLLNHQRLILTIYQSDHFLQERFWKIYPQTVHALVAFTARLTGINPLTLLTPMLQLLFVTLFFVLFLLTQRLYQIQKIPYLMAAIFISPMIYCIRTVFVWYMFPAVVSLLFGIIAVQFLVTHRLFFGSLSLSAAIILYPLNALVLLPLCTSLIFTLSDERLINRLQKLLIGLIIPLFCFLSYVALYLQTSYPQHKVGYNDPGIYDPISFFNVISILLFIYGGVTSSMRSSEKALNGALFLGMCLPFGVIWLLYFKYSVLTTYYLNKLMLIIISFSIPFQVIAMVRLWNFMSKRFNWLSEKHGGICWCIISILFFLFR